LAAYFFDSSAIVKRYVAEIGTGWVGSLVGVAGGNLIYLARLTLVETISAITRKGYGGGISTSAVAKAITDFRHDFLNEYGKIEVTAILIERAASLAEAHALRAYDAVQLAAALQINTDRLAVGLPAVTLISADVALNAAAIAEGLAVDDPNAHP
jgi:predicted nucleic acid-binding protein